MGMRWVRFLAFNCGVVQPRFSLNANNFQHHARIPKFKVRSEKRAFWLAVSINFFSDSSPSEVDWDGDA
jgi:hypothetical protein